MTKQHWLTEALSNDAVVADLLLRMRQSSSPDSSHALPITTWFLHPIGWGHRKSRSKPSVTGVSGNAFKKEQQSGSPTTPFCFSGGGVSTSDGGPSDLSSGGRSAKGALGNEGATTSSYKKSRKRKSFAELKEEEDSLLKERVHLNTELESMRVTMNKEITTSHNLNKFKIDLHQNPDNIINGPVQKSSPIKSKSEKEERGFILPDLNMTPIEEEF